uniref:ADAM10 endopeptidase n=1 Tax=Cacopsylla melanoneura TaxID=428564 RepID=A0A8D8W5K6_9HEMI
MRRDAEAKLRTEEMERRKKVDALRTGEKKTHEELIEEELLRREKQEELVKEELLRREKEEELRKEELLRREKEEELVKEELLRREKAEELVKEEQLRREKEDEQVRKKTSFRPRVREKGGVQNTRRTEAGVENARQGQGGVQNARQGQGGVQNARRGDALRGERRKRRVNGEPYYSDRTMRDESQDIDTILRVEAPNKTIISISKPGLKNGTHRNIITNSRPATEYDDSLNEFDSFFNRNPKFSIIDSKKTTCMLYLQADHLFYEKYGTEEACIEVMTRHVQRVNAIYKNTDFNQDGVPDNITFMIKRIKVHTQESVANNPTYRYHGNYGVEKFLEIFSEEDYDAFCLAYMFTYRDFEMGTLGLAWTGDLKNAGGVCEKNGHYRGSMKSLNTGIVTLLNYGKHVPPAVSHVTLAHEIGHNFGSPHDPEICTPGGDEGNFIMFARATSGDKKNNNRFSQCSLNSINPVLNSKARNGKGCFIQPQVSLCGNGVVEEGEECDCGWEEDCKDVCCHPQRRYPSPGIKPCTLTPGSACSPSQGPCCTGECRVKRGDKCRDDNGCRDASQCDGRHAQCPPSVNKPNKTVCNAEFVCFMGECTGSICLAYGLESCQCIPSPTDSATKACELCCKLPGENQPCLSSFLWNTPPYDVPDMYSKPGTPCNDYNGYCDVFQKCREVDPSGPLATLRKLLLSDESINSVKKWALEHWYYSGLMFFSFLLILVLSARLFGKESNRKKSSHVTIMHSSTTETVRLPSDPSPLGNVTVHPVVVRSKLPLKKKVRERGKKSRGENAAETTGDPASRKIAKKLIEKNVKKNMKPLAKIGEEDPLGKVRHWLLNSHHISNGLSSLRKSKSSPAGFVPVDTVVMTSEKPSDVPAVSTVPAVLPLLPRIEEAVSPGAQASDPAEELSGSGADLEVKLQVVFKPPFKFSVKLRKPNKVDVKKNQPVVAVPGKKIEKSSSSNRLIEEETPPLSKQKLSKHKLMDKNVPEPIKKRAALLIRADKTLRRLPRGMGNKGKKSGPGGKTGKGKKLGTELARLISQESNNSQRLDQEPPSPLAEAEPVYEPMIYQPVYENNEVTSHPPARDKLDKLSKHSRNVEAAMSKRCSSGEISSPVIATDSGERYKRQSSVDSAKMGEGKFTAIDPERARYLTNEDLIDMNGEPNRNRPETGGGAPDTAGQDRKKHQHRSKRKNKQSSPTSTSDPKQKLEKRNSMSDVTKLRNYDASTDAPCGKLRRSDADLSRRSVTTDLRSSNCDLTAAGGGLSCVPAVPAKSKLRHSSSDVMRQRRGSQECLNNRGSQEYLPISRSNMGHRGSQEYLQSRGSNRGVQDHLQGTGRPLGHDKAGRRPGFGSQECLPASSQNRTPASDPTSGSQQLNKSPSGVKLRHKTDLGSGEARKRHSMSELPSSGNHSSRNEPNMSHRMSSRNQTKGNPSKRRNSSRERDTIKRHSMSDVPNSRPSGETVPNRTHLHSGDTTNQMHIYENLLDDVSPPRIVSSKHKDGQTSPLATVNSHGQPIRRNGSRSSLNTGSSSKPTNASSNSLNREASQPRSSSLTRSSPRHPSSSKSSTNVHSTSPHSTSKAHSTNRNSPLSHSASFSSGNKISPGHPNSPVVPDFSPAAAASQRTYSSSDLMRFPSVENEANSRLDLLISGGKKYSANVF